MWHVLLGRITPTIQLTHIMTKRDKADVHITHCQSKTQNGFDQPPFTTAVHPTTDLSTSGLP
jgi:hypothetical protein